MLASCCTFVGYSDQLRFTDVAFRVVALASLTIMDVMLHTYLWMMAASLTLYGNGGACWSTESSVIFIIICRIACLPACLLAL